MKKHKRPDLVKYNKTHPMIGKLNPNYGKKMSQKQKIAISKSCKKYWKNKKHPWKNRKHKQSSKNKIKLSHSKENKIYTIHGYVLIWDSENKLKRKRILEHRFIVEKIIGRKLSSKEIIHHINEIKDDNRPDNLYLFKSQMEHNAYTVLNRLCPYLIKQLKSNLKDVE